METRYYCKYPKRLQEIKKGGTLNAIDYLEVLDSLSPTEELRQRILLVHLVKSITGITVRNVRIEGGVRRTVKVDKVSVAADLTDSLSGMSAEEREIILDNDNPENVLIVETDSVGDFSIYKLKIRRSFASDEPPIGYDPILSGIEFSFKVECPSDFDCQPAQPVIVPKYDEPQIDYLAKDYASFRSQILDRLSVIMPDWKERNVADIGIALVENLAYTGDYLSYYQDTVANEAYLGTSRERISVRRHAKLVDYVMHEGCNSRVWVQLQSDSGDIFIKEGTQLLTAVPGFTTRIAPNSTEYDKAVKLKPETFETMHNSVITDSHNEIRFYTWADEDCCLPQGATRATLLDDELNRLILRKGDVLIFEEIRSSETGLTADKNLDRRHAVRLTEVYPEAEIVEQSDGTYKLELKKDGGVPQSKTDPLNGKFIVDIAWSQDDAMPFSLCLEEVVDPNEESTEKQPVSIARGNIILAEHGRTLGDGKGGVADIPESLSDVGDTTYRPTLKETGISHSVPFDDNKARKLSAVNILVQDPRQAVARVTLRDQYDNEWHAVPDLLASDEFDRDMVVEIENDGQAILRFGDDTLGQAPNEGTQFKAVYHIGNGRDGNVGAESIIHIVSSDDGITKVRNPMSARGGTDAESMEEVRLYAPQAFRTQKRAVTTDDYSAVAMLHTEVQKAETTLRWTGSWHAMFITTDRKNGLEVDDAFESELVDFINSYRLAGHDIEIEPPVIVPLDIIMTVCVKDGYFKDKVKQTLLETFSNIDLPDGRRGFFHPDNFTFGQPVYLSRVVSAAMQVTGVKWVDLSGVKNRFRRWGESDHHEVEEGQISIGRLEIARLDNDPSVPENGKIEFIMEGGL
jgi:hypothetical protein